MTSRLPSQCEFCAHFRSPLDGAPAQTCDAFPNQIPDGVWWNRVDHRTPHPGDHGVRWAPDGDVEFPEYALAE